MNNIVEIRLPSDFDGGQTVIIGSGKAAMHLIDLDANDTPSIIIRERYVIVAKTPNSHILQREPLDAVLVKELHPLNNQPAYSRFLKHYGKNKLR